MVKVALTSSNKSGNTAFENKQTVPVAVIIPCYNCALTIKRAVESILNQTALPAEVILIDDASTDDTIQILEELATQLCGLIKVFKLPFNNGPSSARNVGWVNATQPYIAFLDADDSWHPQKIEVQYGWMHKNPQAFLSAHNYAVDGSAEHFTNTSEEIIARHIPFRRLLLSNYFSTPTVMLKRALQERFAEDKRYAEDYLLWLTIACNYDCYFLTPALARLHKAPYGDSGLSANMWGMEKGELDTYRRLFERRAVSFWIYLVLSLFSLLKYVLRILKRLSKGY